MKSRKATGPVNINTKMSNVETISLPLAGDYTLADGYDMRPGCPLRLSESGTSFEAGGDGSPLIFVNWTDYASADSQMLQGDPFQDSLAERDTEGGRMTAIRGNGVVVEVPAYLFQDGIGAPAVPSVGDYVGAGSDVLLSPQMYAPAWSGKTTPNLGDIYFGVVEKVANGKVTFQFDSVGKYFQT